MPTRPCCAPGTSTASCPCARLPSAIPKSYFHRYASLSDGDASDTATHIWETINLVNLRENVLPTRQRADLILRKGADHIINRVSLRKL